MVDKVLFSSQRQDWKTPREFYLKLNDEFLFDFDPCPSNPTNNGLNIDWGWTNYVNPPYNRDIVLWLRKAIEQLREGRTSVFLLPARTDTKWFHKIVLEYAEEIRFIKGRLHFDDHKNPAPFPSMIVIFRPKREVEK